MGQGATSGGAPAQVAAGTATTPPSGQAPAAPADVAPGSAAAATPTPAQSAAMLGPAGQDQASLAVLATADAWVQVRSSTGAVVFSQLLHAGQTWPVPAGEHLSLTTGNAGGTELVRNGVASPPLGATGAVLHNVPLAATASASARSARASG